MLDRRSRKADRSILLLSLIIVVVAATAVYASLQLRVDRITDALKKKQPVNTLLILSDGEKALFFEVFLYNPETRKGTLYHVPANLGGVIEGLRKVDGIDALYRRGSPAALQKTVERLLGVPLHCVLDIALADAAKLVDLVGGLDLFIPNPVDITPAPQAPFVPAPQAPFVPAPQAPFVPDGRRILLPSGSVTLDGDKTVDFLSYEDPLETEVDRIGRQQKFVQSLLKSLGEERQLLAQRGPFRLVRAFVRTNIPPRALAALLAELARYDSERVIQARVLGATRTVDGRDLLFPHQDGELLLEAVRQAVAANASNEFIPAEDLTVTVQVLNGTATPGLANRAREVFQSYDMDVLAPNNADNDQYPYTVVYDRKGRIEDARRVAELIRCTRVSTQLDLQGDQAVDVTVILGKDFDGRYCK
jgi:anionic cell wall polymer biosynthesis LytR-Cps2A-Psr (LCP) family protein